MKEVTIGVYGNDVEKIIRIGSKRWGILTENEIKEYDCLIKLYGSLVCQRVLEE